MYYLIILYLVQKGNVLRIPDVHKCTGGIDDECPTGEQGGIFFFKDTPRHPVRKLYPVPCNYYSKKC